MRYEDWDVLLFPKDCKVPVKEFRVVCRVVPDTEFAHTHGSFGLPTVCCFVPSLSPGTPFQVSIHSWADLSPISHFTRSYSKYADSVKFEARLFIDGRMVAYEFREWPQVISHCFEFSKNGDLEVLQFPPFHWEILDQSYWVPADDLGRIKIVISEGFPRDSQSMPIERVKNVVAFAFQHAPLDILESSSIAWPNSSMWRHGSSPRPVPAYPSEASESHAHSPRRQTSQQINLYDYEMPGIQNMIPNEPVCSANNFGQRLQSSCSAFGITSGCPVDQWSDEAGNAGSLSFNSSSPHGLKNNSSSLRKDRESRTDALDNSLLDRQVPSQDAFPSIASSTLSCELGSHDIRGSPSSGRVPTETDLPVGIVPSQISTPQAMPSKRGFEAGQKASAGESRTCTVNGSISLSSAALGVISGNSDKGTKRARILTPTSTKIIEEEDEPQRIKPRVGLNTVAEDGRLGAFE